MYLKTIELQGFKSFANKTVLQFHKGITAIVGPNGSGKSNVADAVRWVFGEQSARQLRGTKMEDVIFSGTETRKPLSYASVSLTLDNSDHKLAVDFDEVTVARKVYRSGESQYYLNGSACRRKDVQELFFDTGIGMEGYSIIGQGQIDKILSTRPEERRELFDEAAGIVKYKKRKQAAQKNLMEEEENLSRIDDILLELERQLGPLGRQADVAREYLKLRDRQKELDATLFVSEVNRIRDELKNLQEKIHAVQAQMSETQEAFDQTKEEYEQIEQKSAEYDRLITDAQQEVQEEKILKEQQEGSIRLLDQEMAALQESLKTNTDRQDQQKQEVLQKQQSAQDYEDTLDQILEEISVLRVTRVDAEKKLHQLKKQISSLKDEIDAANNRQIELLNQSARIREKQGRYESMEEQAQLQKTQLQQNLLILSSQRTEDETSVSLYQKELDQILGQIAEANLKSEQLQEEDQKNRKALDETRRQLGIRQQEYHAVSSRFYTLRNINERYEGYGYSIKKVMEQKQHAPGIIGVTADILKVRQEYETAVETALGGSIQHIITSDEETAKQMIAFLKKNRYGRATFLPLTSITIRGGKPPAAVLAEPGVIGLADTLVETQPEYQKVAAYLLGRIVVVETIEDALGLAKKYHYSLRIVTLEGELLAPGGSLSGGAYKNSGNLLSRGRELLELERKTQAIKDEIENLGQEQIRLQNQKAETSKKISENGALLQELSLSENTTRMTLNQARKAHADRAEQAARIEQEEKELHEQTIQIQEMRKNLQEELDSLSKSKEQLQQEVAAFHQDLDGLQNQEQELLADQAKQNLKNAKLDQQRAFAQENLSRLQDELKDLEKEAEDLRQDLENRQKQLKQKHSQKDQNLVYIQDTENRIVQAEQKLIGITNQKEAISAKHREFFSKREELSAILSDLDKESFRLDHQKEKLESDKSAQNEYMWQEYELTYTQALRFQDEKLVREPVSAVKKAAADQKAKIRKLGNVNVNAIAEYEEVQCRYEEMKSQHDDLVEAKKKLDGVIDTLDTAMEKQFREKFALISDNFHTVFQELFGGGRTSLELVQPEDLLNTDIRIIASPPGKKLQNMMMLSGGERALTAIALLFAIQKLKPSPFCLLDEIEAALDDANVKRYANYLNHLTDETQFIMITHRRGTMNAADTLYGITMQEKGISTLVSVSLIDADLEN